MPHKVFKFDGLLLTITPTPNKLTDGKLGNIIGSQMSEFRIINTKEAIRKAIKDKTSRYGELEKPFILAINIMTISCDSGSVMDALFGSKELLFDATNSDVTPRYHRATDGAWNRSKGTRLSGVLVFSKLTPWTVSQSSPTLYLNPWAKYPYDGKFKQLPYVQVQSDGTINFKDGLHPRDIFGLHEGWPR